ncbi:MAG: restriction endonuclease subunit S, partial [Thermodesulfovibrio sp.]|nr:restriction endonuclease subunit S [Thermodesulfovibrio sp.]
VDLDDKNFRKFSLKKGELLFNRTNSYELVGKTALFELGGRYVFASYLIRIVCKEEKVNPKFLNYYLNFDKTQARLKTLASRGVSQSNINATKLKSFPIPLPPLPEQQAITNILQAIDDKIQKEEAKKKALENLFKSMLHNLMSGKIRVKSRIE